MNIPKLGLLLALAGCVRGGQMVPLNDVASASGIPTLSMSLYGTGYGPATVTMPNGEVLTGNYRLAVGGAVSTGFATVSGPRGTAFGSGTSANIPMQNPFTVQAVGNRGTYMICQGSAGGMGHGEAVCTTNTKAEYQMMF